MLAEFVDMLNEMRFGRLTPRSIAKFKSLSREIHYEDGLGTTELYANFLFPISCKSYLHTAFHVVKMSIGPTLLACPTFQAEMSYSMLATAVPSRT
jgi:hypothetical protein